MGDFLYQAIWHPGMKAWNRVSISELSHVVEDVPDIYQTAQLFSSLQSSEEEEHFAHPYFDIDCEGNIPQALTDARKISNYFKGLGCEGEDQRWNFSGAKGFHGIMNGYALGVEASECATSILKFAASHLTRLLSVSTIDPRVYTLARLLRVPGTIHSKSGLRAITLGTDSLHKYSAEEIIEAAKKDSQPQPLWRHFEECDPVDDTWWSTFRDCWRVHSRIKKNQRHKLREFDKDPKDWPLCMRTLYMDGTSETFRGGRNDATFLISLGMKEGGLSKELAEEMIDQWTIGEHMAATGESHCPPRVKRNALSTISSVFDNDDRYFSCNVVRAMGCQCDEEACTKLIREGTALDVRRVTLDEAVDADYANIEIEIEGIVIGRDRTPILMPSEATIVCSPQPENPVCSKCKLNPTGQAHTSLDKELWAAMPMAFSGRDKRTELFSRMAKIPDACPGHKVNIVKHGNMTFCAVQPFVNANLNGKQVWRENDVAVLSSSIEDQKIYTFRGQTHEHPKTSRSVTVARSHKEKNVDLDTFEVTDDVREKLSRYQSDQPWDKLQEIHKEWEELVHGIHGRRSQAIGMALPWFSPLAFRLQNRNVPRGWLEVLALGDTAQGKTEIANAFQRHMDAGYVVSGENLSVAGLIAGVDKVNGQHIYRLGALPRNDRRLVIFEEFGAAPEDAKRSLSDVRSSGLARLNKIISLSAPARCRKVILANPIHHKQSVWMSSIAYPIEHVLEVMGRSPEDVRRLDLVCGFSDSEEIRREIYKARDVLGRTLRYDSESARLLCLWVWSRRPDQIVFTDEAIQEINILAEGFSNEYCREIPLWDPGDSRNKVARLAASVAGHLFSTDDGRTLRVTGDHVRAVCDLVTSLYSGPDLVFVQLSAVRHETQRVSWEEVTDCSIAIAFDKAINGVEFFSQNKIVTQRDLVNVCDMTDPQANHFLNQMRRKYLLQRKGVGLTLTNKGTQVIRTILAHTRDHGGLWPHGVVPRQRFDFREYSDED